MSQQGLRTVRSLLAKSTPGTSPADTDDALRAQFVRDRDPAAFAELLRRHGPMALGVCRRVLGDGPDAEDAFQATFLVFALKAAVAPGPSLRAWLHGVAYRVARNARKGRDRRRRHEQAALRPEAAPPGPDSHDATELRRALDEELARLPERYRAAFLLCHLDGRTRPEAAKELGCSEGTLSSRLARAKDLLQRSLRARGIAPAVALAVPPTATGVAAAVPPPLTAAAVQTARAVAAAGRVTSVVPPAVAALVKSATAATVRPLALVVGVALAAGVSAWGAAQERPARPGLQSDAMAAADSLREILPRPGATPSGRPDPASDRASLTRGEPPGIRNGESMMEQVRTLVNPPTRLGKGQDGVLYATRTALGEVEMRVWIAGSPAESDEIRRFEAAAARLDWSAGPQEVRWPGTDHSGSRAGRPEGPRGDGPENEVFDRLALSVAADSVALPAAESLDEFERASGFALPVSYRRFVLRFGPGTFEKANEIAIASPGYPTTLDRFDLGRYNRAYRRRDLTDDDIRRNFGPDVARVRRLVMFANGNDGDEYGWDPQDVTDAAGREYGVYLLPRRGEPLVQRVAGTFPEFVAGRCFRGTRPQLYRAHHDAFARRYETARAFLDETGWPLGPGQDVGDFAHSLGGELHCSPRSKLSRTFKKWLKAKFGKDATWY